MGPDRIWSLGSDSHPATLATHRRIADLYCDPEGDEAEDVGVKAGAAEESHSAPCYPATQQAEPATQPPPIPATPLSTALFASCDRLPSPSTPVDPVIPDGWQPAVDPLTAADLLARLGAAGVRVMVDGQVLVMGPAPPPDLRGPAGILHAGLRAVLTGRRWLVTWISPTPTRDGGRQTRVAVLDPAKAVPIGARLLCCEGDAIWDRIPHTAVRDFPSLFGPPLPKPLTPAAQRRKDARRAVSHRHH